MLSGPVGFVLSMFYCWFLARALRRTERIRRVIRARKRMAEGMETAVRRLDRLRRLVFFGSLVVSFSSFIFVVLSPISPADGRLDYFVVTSAVIDVAIFLAYRFDAAQDHLRGVSKSHRVTDWNAILRLQDEKSSEHFIYGDSGLEVVRVSEKFFGN